MPEEFHHPPTFSVALLGVNHPIPKPDVVFYWSLENLVSRYGKLGATSRGGVTSEVHCLITVLFQRHGVRCRGVPSFGVVNRWRTRIVEQFFPDGWAHMCICGVASAPGLPLAPEIDIAAASDKGNLEGAHGIDIIVQG
jgi:hypothetical protein